VACCFTHQVDALCPHQANGFLGIADAFLVLEECVVGVIVLFIDTRMKYLTFKSP
jgi:hypothetical protein